MCAVGATYLDDLALFVPSAADGQFSRKARHGSGGVQGVANAYDNPFKFAE